MCAASSDVHAYNEVSATVVVFHQASNIGDYKCYLPSQRQPQLDRFPRVQISTGLGTTRFNRPFSLVANGDDTLTTALTLPDVSNSVTSMLQALLSIL